MPITTAQPKRRRFRRNRVSVEQTHANAIIRANKVIAPEPPTHQASHHYVQRFRFTTQANLSTYPINPADFANLLLVALEDFAANSGNLCAPVYTRFLFKSMEMWAIPSSLAAPVTLILTPQNVGTTSVNTESTISDTSKSIDRYAYVRYRPKITSPIAQYQSQDSTSAGVRITCPAGTIIDLVLHVWICNGEIPTQPLIYYDTTSPIPYAPVAGQVFLAALDPSPTGKSLILPVDYVNPYDNSAVPTPRP